MDCLFFVRLSQGYWQRWCLVDLDSNGTHRLSRSVCSAVTLFPQYIQLSFLNCLNIVTCSHINTTATCALRCRAKAVFIHLFSSNFQWNCQWIQSINLSAITVTLLGCKMLLVNKGQAAKSTSEERRILFEQWWHTSADALVTSWPFM